MKTKDLSWCDLDAKWTPTAVFLLFGRRPDSRSERKKIEAAKLKRNDKATIHRPVTTATEQSRADVETVIDSLLGEISKYCKLANGLTFEGLANLPFLVKRPTVSMKTLKWSWTACTQ